MIISTLFRCWFQLLGLCLDSDWGCAPEPRLVNSHLSDPHFGTPVSEFVTMLLSVDKYYSFQCGTSMCYVQIVTGFN